MLKLPKRGKQPTVFTIPEDFITFLGLDENSEFIFRITVGVDAFRAMTSDATTLRIGAYPIKRSGAVATAVRTNSVKDFSSEVASRTARLRQSRRAFEKSKITEIILDLTAFIDNDLGSTAFSPSGDVTITTSAMAGQTEQTISLRKVKTFIRLLDSQDTRKGAGGQFVPSSGPVILSTALSTTQYRDLSDKVINVLGNDPAQVLDFDFPIIDAKRSMGGSIKASNARSYRKIGSELKQDLRSPSEKSDNQICTSTSVLTSPEPQKNFELSLRKALTMVSINKPSDRLILDSVSSRFTSMSAILKIPAMQRGRTPVIHMEFVCLNSKGSRLQKESNSFNISSLCGAKEMPQIPPWLHVEIRDVGLNVLHLQQRDPYAERITVYRRILENLPELQLQNTFEKVGDINIKQTDGSLFFEDRVENGKKIMYRAFAVGRGGTIGRKFASAVGLPSKITKNYPPSSDGVRSDHGLTFTGVERASFTTQVLSDKIAIVVNTYCNNFSACFLEVRDITGLQNPQIKRVKPRIVGSTIDEKLKPFQADRTQFRFSDEDVQHNRTYHYSLVVMRYDGRKTTLSGSVIKTYIKPQKGLTLIVENMTSFVGGVSWDMKAESKKVGLETIVSQLKSLGATQSFLDDISNSRDQFSSLFRFLVTRRNLRTNITERLGIFEAGTFKDDLDLATKTGCELLSPGYSYEYEVTLLERDQLTILQGIAVDDKDVSTLKIFSRNLRKFRNPTTTRSAVLPSGEKLEIAINNPALSIDDEFLQGDTGVVELIPYSVPIEGYTISKPIAQVNSDGSNTITWVVSGDSTPIDHFIIFSEVSSIKAPIGTTVNLESGRVFSYRDNKTAGLVGTKTYTVIPVLSNFNIGAESNSVSITKRLEIPRYEVVE